MKKINILILFSITYFLFSCGDEIKKQPKKTIQPVNALTPAPAKIKFSKKKITASKEVSAKKITGKEDAFVVKKEIEITSQLSNPTKKTENTAVDIRKEVNEKLLSFVNIRKILDNCKMGQTMTQEQLTQHFEIPEDAVKLVKSVTKTAENELSVKWKSTWLVEKVSDAELEDGKMKVKFRANKMYMSGNAIGIKYNRKIYNDLIIIGRSAYIPSVKGYSWQIGK